MKMNISLPVEIDIPDCVIEVIRNKAIDDFVRRFNITIDEKCGTDTNNYFRKIVEEIAEQLKGGGVNE